MNLAGQLLAGKYQLKNRLGQGTMGTVYLATQIKLKRDVAVKILNTDSDIYRTRFEREAKTAASLTHPHIVSIFDYGIEGDIHYVAMPYISGGTLAKRYTNSLKIPTLFETTTIISQVASALDHAHSRGIVHRDVKPSNIMTDEQGNAFLADFGIVRLLETTYTLGKPLGTPTYMPPEQWDNTSDLSQATDQYALAVMAFQLIVGDLPFDGDTQPELKRAHIYEVPKNVQTYRSDLSKEINDVIHKALSKDPADRYASAGEFALAFKDAVESAEITSSLGHTLADRDVQLDHTLVDRDIQLDHTLVERDAPLDRTALEGVSSAQFVIENPIKKPDPIELIRPDAVAFPLNLVPYARYSIIPIIVLLLGSIIYFSINSSAEHTQSTSVDVTGEPAQPTVIPAGSEVAMEQALAGVRSNAEWESLYPEGYVQEFDGVEMVLVPKGCFMMGSSVDEFDYAQNVLDADLDWIQNEDPVHQQCIEAPFWIDRYEVTQSDFARLGGEQDEASEFAGDDRPVEQITWFEAHDFCALRGGRLPTEIEWEYAASGSSNLYFPWGNEWDSNIVAWLGNANNQTEVVGGYSASMSWIGAYDMSGNVWEWVSSLYQAYPYDTAYENDTDTTSARVSRGGSWYNRDAYLFRASARTYWTPEYFKDNLGFRCVRA